MNDGHDFKNDEYLKYELNNNIYPSLRDVVKNRYYIIIGIFGYYGYRLLNAASIKNVDWRMIDCGVRRV